MKGVEVYQNEHPQQSVKVMGRTTICVELGNGNLLVINV